MPDYKKEIAELKSQLKDNFLSYHTEKNRNTGDDEKLAQQRQLDSYVDLSKVLATKLALYTIADREGNVVTSEDIENQVKNVTDKGIVKYALGRKESDVVRSVSGFDIVWGKGNIKEPKETENSAKEFDESIDSLCSWIKEEQGKEKFYQEFEEKELGKGLVGKQLDHAKATYVEESFAKEEFARLNSLLPEEKRLTGDKYAEYEKDFIGVWNMNQTVKESSYKNGISSAEIFEMTISTSKEDVELNQRRVQIIEAEKAGTKKSYDLTPAQKGAVARSLAALENRDGTEAAKKENEEMIANLKSDNPEVNAAEKRKLYQKFANKVLSLKDEWLDPKTPEEAFEMYEKHYPEMYLAFESQYMISTMEAECSFPPEIKEAMLHKSALFQERISKFEDYFKEQSNPDKAKVSFIKKVGSEAVLKSVSQGYSHSFPPEDMGSILASATMGAKEEVFGANNNELTQPDPQKYDNLHFDGNFGPADPEKAAAAEEAKRVREAKKKDEDVLEGFEEIDPEVEFSLEKGTLQQDLQDKHYASQDAEITFYNSENEIVEEGERINFAKGNVYAEVYEKGDPLGKRMAISMNNMGQLQFAKPTVISKERDLSNAVNNPRENTAEFNKLAQMLKATDPFYVLTNSKEFNDVKKGLNLLMKAQKALGDNPSLKQVRDYKKIQDDFAKKCGDYITKKTDKLKSRTNDPRGQLRYNIIKSMQSLLTSEHTDKVLRNGETYRTYAESNEKVSSFKTAAKEFQNKLVHGRMIDNQFKQELQDLQQLGKETYKNVSNDPCALSSMNLSMMNLKDAMVGMHNREGMFTSEELSEVRYMSKECSKANEVMAKEFSKGPSLEEAMNPQNKPKEKEAQAPAQGGPGLR